MKPSPRARGTRLLTLLTITELALAGAGLIACGFLVSSTARLHGLSSQIAVAVESIYVAEETREALLQHGREALEHELSQRPEDLQDRIGARKQLDGWLRRLGDFSETAREKELLSEAMERIRFYLLERDRLEEAALTSAEMTVATSRAAELCDRAAAPLEQLVQINYEQSQALQKQAQSEDETATLIGVCAAIAVLLALGGAFVMLHRKLRLPLVHLKQEMQNLEAGKLSTIDAEGPAELREIAAVLNHLIERLNEQRASQLRFIAGIAHDLRTPLNAMKLSVDYVSGGGLAGDELESLRAINRQVAQLDGQVGDLLDMARIEAGHLQLRRGSHDLCELVRNAATLFRGASTRHLVKVSVPAEPVTASCDAIRLGQVLNNLVSNAIKYSPAGGEVRISLAREAGAPQRAHIVVEDEGLGIGAEDLPHIFEPFRRAAATREAIPGVGLGLSVARRIIEGHGGAISLTSAPGAGSAFTVRLPVEDAVSPVAPAASPATGIASAPPLTPSADTAKLAELVEVTKV